MGSETRLVPVQQRLGRLLECLEAAHTALDRVDGLRASRQLSTSCSARHVDTFALRIALVDPLMTLIIESPGRCDPCRSVGTRGPSGASLGAP